MMTATLTRVIGLMTISVIAYGSLAGSVWAADATRSVDQKTLYAIGLMVNRSLMAFDLSADELETVKKAITDANRGVKSDVDLAVYNEKVQELARTRRKAQSEKTAAANKGFLDKAAQEKGVVKTESGLLFLHLTEGAGASPKATDTVKVNYRGSLPDGREFDSSYKRGKPAEFRLDGVIKCWTEGVQRMKVGGKAKLICPSSIAYGDTGAGDMILPGAALVFEVELLDIKK